MTLHLPWRERVGGMWEELGLLQFHYVTQTWRVPESASFLDVGCGPGRLGRTLVPYLAAGGGSYVGTDVDPYLLGKFREEVDGDAYRLVTDAHFEFPGLAQHSFDYAWAQSVATHLPMAQVEAMLAGVRRMVRAGGEFGLTFFDPTDINPVVETYPHRDPYAHSVRALAEAAHRAGWDRLRLEHPAMWPHPRRQRLVVLTA